MACSEGCWLVRCVRSVRCWFEKDYDRTLFVYLIVFTIVLFQISGDWIRKYEKYAGWAQVYASFIAVILTGYITRIQIRKRDNAKSRRNLETVAVVISLGAQAVKEVEDTIFIPPPGGGVVILLSS